MTMTEQTASIKLSTIERLLKIAKTGQRADIVGALQDELNKVTGDLFCGMSDKPALDVEAKFELFWSSYPRRKGSNPKDPARKLFFQRVKQGADPDVIIRGAVGYARSAREHLNTSFIAQAMTWLRQNRWKDYQPPGSAGASWPGGPGPLDPKEARRLAALEESRGSLG